MRADGYRTRLKFRDTNNIKTKFFPDLKERKVRKNTV